MRSVKVLARIKPPSEIKNRCIRISRDEKKISIHEPRRDVANKIQYMRRQYELDRVYDIDYDNVSIFDELSENIVKDFYQRMNTTFYVYGETGTGKTHTVIGYPGEEGILYYLLEKITRYNRHANEVHVTSLQIHMGKIYDVFDENAVVKEYYNRYGELQLHDMKRFHITNSNIDACIQLLRNKRQSGISSANNTSSRSHLLVQIQVGGTYIRLLDLAGSEKLKDGIANKYLVQRENAEINKSIMAVKECIRALKKGEKRIPYRMHKLTRLLKESFEGKGSTYLMATISSDESRLRSTINTLQVMADLIGARYSCIKVDSLPKYRLQSSTSFQSFMQVEKNRKEIHYHLEDILDVMKEARSTKEKRMEVLGLIEKEIQVLYNLREYLS